MKYIIFAIFVIGFIFIGNHFLEENSFKEELKVINDDAIAMKVIEKNETNQNIVKLEEKSLKEYSDLNHSKTSQANTIEEVKVLDEDKLEEQDVVFQKETELRKSTENDEKNISIPEKLSQTSEEHLDTISKEGVNIPKTIQSHKKDLIISDKELSTVKQDKASNEKPLQKIIKEEDEEVLTLKAKNFTLDDEIIENNDMKTKEKKEGNIKILSQLQINEMSSYLYNSNAQFTQKEIDEILQEYTDKMSKKEYMSEAEKENFMRVKVKGKLILEQLKGLTNE